MNQISFKQAEGFLASIFKTSGTKAFLIFLIRKISGQRSTIDSSGRSNQKDPLDLLFIPNETLGEHLHLAPSSLRFHEDCECSISPKTSRQFGMRVFLVA